MAKGKSVKSSERISEIDLVMESVEVKSEPRKLKTESQKPELTKKWYIYI